MSPGRLEFGGRRHFRGAPIQGARSPTYLRGKLAANLALPEG